MRYLLDVDSYTKIAETTGTIQNPDPIFIVEGYWYCHDQRRNPNNETVPFMLYPMQSFVFDDVDIYVRSAEPNSKAAIRVVPFKVRKVEG